MNFSKMDPPGVAIADFLTSGLTDWGINFCFDLL